jgi:hypothetical protein
MALGVLVSASAIGTVLWLVNGFHRKVKNVVDLHNAEFLLRFTRMAEEHAHEAEVHSRSVRALAASIIKIEERLDKIEALLMRRSDDRDVDPAV